MGREDIARNPRRFYKVIASVMGSINKLHLELDAGRQIIACSPVMASSRQQLFGRGDCGLAFLWELLT
jgi:hypothetical protein